MYLYLFLFIGNFVQKRNLLRCHCVKLFLCHDMLFLKDHSLLPKGSVTNGLRQASKIVADPPLHRVLEVYKSCREADCCQSPSQWREWHAAVCICPWQQHGDGGGENRFIDGEKLHHHWRWQVVFSLLCLLDEEADVWEGCLVSTVISTVFTTFKLQVVVTAQSHQSISLI